MTVTRENIIIVLGAAIACLLQFLVAPYVCVASVSPNFMLAYAMAVAVVRPGSHRVAYLSFTMGLLYNLFCGGIVGSLALCLVGFCQLAGSAMRTLDNDTVFMPLSICCIGAFAVDFAYGFIAFLAGTGSGFIETIIYRAFPCAVYDAIVTVVVYLIMSRVAAEKSTTIPPVGGPTLLR